MKQFTLCWSLLVLLTIITYLKFKTFDIRKTKSVYQILTDMDILMLIYIIFFKIFQHVNNVHGKISNTLVPFLSYIRNRHSSKHHFKPIISKISQLLPSTKC